MSTRDIDLLERNKSDIPSLPAWNFVGATLLDERSGKVLKYSHLKNQKQAPRWRDAEHAEFVRLVTESKTMS